MDARPCSESCLAFRRWDQYSPAVGVGKLGQVHELRFQVGLEPFSNELVETLGKWMGESNGPVSLGFAGILIRLGNPD